jgi:TM2 domain-containing membrane protein YozV
MKRTLMISATTVCAFILQARGDVAESTVVLQPKIALHSYDAMPKDPLASAFFSATICGSGQIYNKEYTRGIATGVAFWGSFFTAEYLLYRYQAINTDTFNVLEADDPTIKHSVTAMKPENLQVGLPTGQKALLVGAVVIGASAYVWGIIDSYRGAQRYNKKLLADAIIKPELYCSLSSQRNEMGLRLRF